LFYGKDCAPGLIHHVEPDRCSGGTDNNRATLEKDWWIREQVMTTASKVRCKTVAKAGGMIQEEIRGTEVAIYDKHKKGIGVQERYQGKLEGLKKALEILRTV
jgi:hypothetical protein